MIPGISRMPSHPIAGRHNSPMVYTNPVWPHYFADPFVLHSQGAYYAYGTGGVHAHGRESDDRVFDVLRSNDLVHWDWVAGALEPLNDPEKPAYWAPEVAERDGRFCMYYSAGGPEGQNHRLRLATSDSPAGPFTDKGIEILPDLPFSIDASPFRDPMDGRWYLYFATDFFDGLPGTGIAGVLLADDMKSPAGPVTPLLRAAWDWQIYKRNRLWYGRTWPAWYTVEAPFVVPHDGRYYLFYSGGRWETAEYGVGFAVADSPLGPFRNDQDADGPSVLRGIPGSVPGPGHNCVVNGPDGTGQFVVYHAWDAEFTARRMCIDPLLWTPSGPRCDGPSTTARVIQ